MPAKYVAVKGYIMYVKGWTDEAMIKEKQDTSCQILSGYTEIFNLSTFLDLNSSQYLLQNSNR
jgi:hypothetical protein